MSALNTGWYPIETPQDFAANNVALAAAIAANLAADAVVDERVAVELADTYDAQVVELAGLQAASAILQGTFPPPVKIDTPFNVQGTTGNVLTILNIPNLAAGIYVLNIFVEVSTSVDVYACNFFLYDNGVIVQEAFVPLGTHTTGFAVCTLFFKAPTNSMTVRARILGAGAGNASSFNGNMELFSVL